MKRGIAKTYRELNERSVHYVALVMVCLVNPIYFLFIFLNTLDLSIPARKWLLFQNVSQFAFFAGVLLLRKMKPLLLLRYATPLAYGVCVVIIGATTARIYLFSSGHQEVNLFMEFLVMSILLHDHIARTLVFQAAMLLTSGVLIVNHGVPLTEFLEYLIMLIGATVATSSFRERIDRQTHESKAMVINLREDNEQLHLAKTDLEHRQLELAERGRAVSLTRLANGMAHEINNPLAVISGSMVILQKKVLEKSHEKTEYEKVLLVHKGAVARISEIVRSLKYFAQSPSFEEKTVCSIEDALRAVTALVNLELKLHSISFHLDVSPQLDQQSMVSVTVIRVLDSLLRNAIDEVNEISRKDITLRVWGEDCRINFRVIDSGNGVQKDNVVKIFEPFFSTKGAAGRGLGLSEAKGMTQMCGGSIEYVESEEETTFEVSYPLAG